MSAPPSARTIDGWRGRDLDRSHVLFVTHAADRTGAPLLLLWFLRWLRAHSTVDFEVLVLRDGPLVADFEALATVHVIGLLDDRPETARHEWATALGIRDERLARDHERQLRQQAADLRGFDVLYVNSALSGACFDLLPEIPPLVISSLHDMGTSFSHFVGERSRQAILERSDWFVTCADAVAATLVGGFGVRRDRIVRHHGFIEPLEPDPEGAAALRSQLGIPEDATVVGGAGTLQWRKGPDLFVQVAATVVRRRPDLDVRFVWAGGPDPHGEELPIAHDIAQLGLDGRCHILGRYDSAAAAIGAFDLFCLTSREDPFPLVMLEAAGLGVPLVSFASGGVTELASASGDPDAPLACIVAPLDVDAMADQVIALVTDPAAADELAERARRHVLAEHIAEAAAPRLLADLREIVATPARSWPDAGRRAVRG